MYFTNREKSILVCLQQGKSNKLMAFALGLSPNTIKVYMHRLGTKLGTTSRGQMMLRAQQEEDAFPKVRRLLSSSTFTLDQVRELQSLILSRSSDPLPLGEQPFWKGVENRTAYQA